MRAARPCSCSTSAHWRPLLWRSRSPETSHHSYPWCIEKVVSSKLRWPLSPSEISEIPPFGRISMCVSELWGGGGRGGRGAGSALRRAGTIGCSATLGEATSINQKQRARWGGPRDASSLRRVRNQRHKRSLCMRTKAAGWGAVGGARVSPWGHGSGPLPVEGAQP